MAASTDLTRDERRLRAQLAANTRWSKPGAREHQSRKLSEARLARYEDQVDPYGVLEPGERRQLAENALRADMQRLALRSSKARRSRKKAAS
jgi:hypothetical protein